MSDATPDPDQPRWPRDSEAEDYELHRAQAHDALSAAEWQRKAERLAARLGLAPPPRPGDGPETWTYPVPPRWWGLYGPPEPRCPLCQRPLAGDEPQRPHPWPGQVWCCEGCAEAQQAHPASEALARHWTERPDQLRRLDLASRFRMDPWSGRDCRIRAETMTVDPDEGITLDPAGPWIAGGVPACYWGPGTPSG